MSMTLMSVFIAFVVAAAPACSGDDTALPSAITTNQERFASRGKVVAIKGKMVDIHHEAMASVRGFDGTLSPMMSMTMTFAAPPPGVGSIVAGDVISFEFTVHYDSPPTLRLTRLDKLPADTRLSLE